MNALDEDNVGNHVNLVSIPDGLEPWEDRNDLRKLTASALEVGWAFEVAEKMRIRLMAFYQAAAALWALGFSIRQLIAAAIVDSYGIWDFTFPLASTGKQKLTNIEKNTPSFEKLACLDWLDQQPAQSVIYVAFGSFTVFDQIQFQEDDIDIIRQDEIKGKVEQLLANEALKAAPVLKEMTAKNVKEGDCSSNNLNNFVQWLKEQASFSCY
ncbi:hypothetical protein Vadar_030290 [Vaccinium darrowii]|uniref:Uncharacterized protein n=1 Tax=Vaccinium darrowii TaxID=229202 RepID=A0ACB7Y3J2_9ERIC|nr:hypothetical protein Vadar_030290 [Vaccinium darrowii]